MFLQEIKNGIVGVVEPIILEATKVQTLIIAPEVLTYNSPGLEVHRTIRHKVQVGRDGGVGLPTRAAQTCL